MPTISPARTVRSTSAKCLAAERFSISSTGSVATGGDPLLREFKSRGRTARKLVLILDVSGSMAAYSRALLLYLHAARGSGRRVEAFAFGTRLTRLTHDLASRDPEVALEAATRRVVE